MHLIVGSLSEIQQPPNTYLLSSIKGPFGTSGGMGIPYEISRKPVLDLHAGQLFIYIAHQSLQGSQPQMRLVPPLSFYLQAWEPQ